MTPATGAAALVASGRYAIHFAGREVGEERWRVTPADDGGAIATGEQVLESPHPIPSRMEWRARLSAAGRVTGVEVRWLVGERELVSEHAASGGTWRARIRYGGHTREQEGDYPPACEVLLGSHLFHAFALSRYALEPGAEHVFPALVIGPPYMAVEPGRARVVCTAKAVRAGVAGPVEARRVEVHDALGGAPPVVLWLDAHDLVIESYEDEGETSPWMTLAGIER